MKTDWGFHLFTRHFSSPGSPGTEVGGGVTHYLLVCGGGRLIGLLLLGDPALPTRTHTQTHTGTHTHARTLAFSTSACVCFKGGCRCGNHVSVCVSVGATEAHWGSQTEACMKFWQYLDKVDAALQPENRQCVASQVPTGLLSILSGAQWTSQTVVNSAADTNWSHIWVWTLSGAVSAAYLTNEAFVKLPQ